MLQITRRDGSIGSPGGSGSADELYSAFSGFVRRQVPTILGVALLCVGLAVVYVLNAPVYYTARASMIIDTRKVNVFQQQSIMGDIQVDSATVESQVEILRSENIALAVIKELRLTEDPEFVGSGGGLMGTLFSSVAEWIGYQNPKSEFELMRRAMETFSDNLAVKRIGLSYIMEVSFRSLDPNRAAQIANAVGESYIVDQLDAKYKATQRASVWLQDRIHELRLQASAAQRAVVDFKTKNNIVDAGGRLMGEQQLSEINTQLILTRGQTAEARAKLARIQEIIQAEVPDATVADSLKNEVITKLRQQYLELKAREADWSARYGRNHLAAVHLRSQMAEIRRSILDELQRIAQTYKSEYEIALQREAAIQQGFAEAVSNSQTTNQAQVTLRELESSAQSYRSLYDNFLQRYMEAVQQQTFPITEARVITAASKPLKKSHPRTGLILSMATALGLLLGFGVARLRDLSDRAFRTASQVETQLNANCLAILPALSDKKRRPKGKGRLKPGEKAGERIIVCDNGMFCEVLDQPFSRYSEAIRSIKVAADLSLNKKSNKIIGITSTLPNEGKSTIAASLAQVIAQSGAKVVLVDGDLRNPSLTRLLAPRAQAGVIEVLSGASTFANAKWTHPETKLDFLPTLIKTRTAQTNEILASDATKSLFETLRSMYEYVIVDLSPLAPIVDVRTTAHLVDSYLFVIEWGKTNSDAVARATNEAPNVFQNLLGVILNKANVSVLRRYEAYKGSYDYNKYYARYTQKT